MDLLKKHYEKILLGVVLIGLAVAVAFLPFKIASDKQALQEQSDRLIHPKVKPLTNLDLTIADNAIKRAASPAVINFGEPNKLFNPLPWQKTAPPDEHLIPVTRVGPTATIVTNSVPLKLRLTLDSVTVSETGAKYVIGVQKEAAATAAQRSKKQTYCTVNTKNDTFQLLEVKGKPEEPTELVVVLNDTGQRAVITKEKPFERIDGWMVDLRYPPENKQWASRRIGAVLQFNGEEYNIVAISKNEVVLSAKSNGKKWTIKNTANVGT